MYISLAHQHHLLLQGNRQVTRAAVEFYGPDRAKFLGEFTFLQLCRRCEACRRLVCSRFPAAYPDLPSLLQDPSARVSPPTTCRVSSPETMAGTQLVCPQTPRPSPATGRLVGRLSAPSGYSPLLEVVCLHRLDTRPCSKLSFGLRLLLVERLSMLMFVFAGRSRSSTPGGPCLVLWVA